MPEFLSVAALTDTFHPAAPGRPADDSAAQGRTGWLTLAYVGDGANNMAHSCALGGASRTAHPDRAPAVPTRSGRVDACRKRPSAQVAASP